MKKNHAIIILFLFTIINGFSQENSNIECETTDFSIEKLYCKYCTHEGQTNIKLKTTKSQYAYFNFEGKPAIDIVLLAGGTAQRPDYIVHIIIPKESLSSGSLKTNIIDEWGNGLDNSKSVIVKFQYRVNNSNSSISQWSNWGGHKKGQSEGKLSLKMQEDGSICGSFSCTVYEDGSSMDNDKKSTILCKSFKATL